MKVNKKFKEQIETLSAKNPAQIHNDSEIEDNEEQ